MAEHTIPVDLFNPGQVLGCLGFLEAADVLCGEAEGGFDWRNEGNVRFVLRAEGEGNPFEVVLRFLAEAEVEVVCPAGVRGPWHVGARASETFPAHLKELLKSDPKKGYTDSALPIAIAGGGKLVPVTNWLEGDGRDVLKLFAGKQIGSQLASNMLKGDTKKPGTVGHRHLFPRIRDAGYVDPFGEVGPVGGRFGYDARGAWDAIRIGTSLDKLGVAVSVSPCVEILAATGLEHARPVFPSTYEIQYAAWGAILPLALARIALTEHATFLPRRQRRSFRAHLGDDQQYKKCFPAQEEPRT
jgi:CRISPR-associated protein Csx14